MDLEGVDVLFALPGADTVVGSDDNGLQRVAEAVQAGPRLEYVPCVTDATPCSYGTAGHSESPECQSDSSRISFVGKGSVYSSNDNLLDNIERYTERCMNRLGDQSFDVIHAHDWLTFPAGKALAERTGKPLVAHVHSTEFDRSAIKADDRIKAIESSGLEAANIVITVSNKTKNAVVNNYGVSQKKVHVVHNGVNVDGLERFEPKTDERIVLFLGRVTHQKGPGYFLDAARRVLEVDENVRFVVAGTGDLIPEMIERVADTKMRSKFTFTGFLPREDVKRVFEMASVFVMPSVSEPFGIATLEAISHRVPVIVSAAAGVSEVLKHALKVDFRDSVDIADKILAVLNRPALAATLREAAAKEIGGLSWQTAASKCIDLYREALKDIYTQITK